MHDLLHNFQHEYAFLITLSMIKEDFPWIYNIGKELIDVLKLSNDSVIKQDMIMDFKRMLEYTCSHPSFREISMVQRESYMFLREVQYTLNNILEKLASEELQYPKQKKRIDV